MSSIVLTPAVRANLLALRDTSELMNTIQQRLATSKRVNSALDNPTNFFTAQSLSHRAGDLNALLDQIGQAQQVLHATDNGLTALTKLVQSAKSIAEQAKQAPQTATNYSGDAQSGGPVDVTPQPATTITGAPLYSIGFTGPGAMTIRVGGVPYSVSVTAVTSADPVVTDINSSPGLGPAGAATASKDAFGHVVLTSNSAATMTVDWSTTAMATGLYNPDLVQVIPGLNGTSLTVQANDTPPKTVTFGNAPGEVSTYGDLKQALAGTNVDDFIFGISGPPNLLLYSPVPFTRPLNSEFSLKLGGTALAPLGIPAGTVYAGLSGTPDPTRASLAQQYNQILQQIDQLAGDTSYNGTNLLKGDNLNVAFNQTGLSSLSINGVVDSLAGLGLTAVSSDGLQTNADVDAHISALTAALATLRSQASQFGSSLSTVQIRQDFTNQMIATLQSGANGLVLADSNQEGANLLALQTRQQLSTTALSLAAQSDQAVLRLFQ